MVDPQRLAPLRGEPARVEACWLCGIRLSTDQMVADGGGSCTDLHWYCRDVRGCTERWTAHPARPADIGLGAAEPAEAAAQAPSLPKRRPAGAGSGPGYRSR